jgi:hypothetical protein
MYINVKFINKCIFCRMTSKKKNKSKHKKKKGNFENADDSLRILLQDEAFVYCKMENYEKAIRQYTAVNIFHNDSLVQYEILLNNIV